jgi:hypothetical protein
MTLNYPEKMKKNKFIYILLFFAIASCTTSSKSGYTLNLPINISDSIKSSGFIVFNRNNGRHKFYNDPKISISDTNKYLKKRIRLKEDFNYIQPYDVKKNARIYDFLPGNEKDSKVFIKNIKSDGDFSWIYTKEVFLILKDANGKKYLTSKLWKPFIMKE